jgi:hypothetical protein
MERERPIVISRVEQESEDAPGWIEAKELIRKASPNQASRLAHWFADRRDAKGYLDES